jgi:hypothetical protein
MRKVLSLLGILAFLLSPAYLAADIPKLINYQGMLTDNLGNPITGKVEIIFKIYNDSTSGTKKWEETQTGVVVTDGLFNVVLGSVTTLDTLSFEEDYWLDINVDGEQMPRRLRFTSVGYAYRAQVADSARTAASAGGGGWIDAGTSVRLEDPDDLVGIGIDSPKYKTDIGIGSSGGTALRLRSMGGSNNLQTILRFTNTPNNDNTGQYSSYIAGLRTNSPSTGAQALVFATSHSFAIPTEKMRIDPQGNVGIGKTNPAYKLDVGGDIRTSGDLYIPSDTGRIRNGNGNPVLETWWSSDFGDYTAINSGYAWTGSEPYSLVAGAKGFFFTKGSGGTPYGSKLVRIDTSGNVGIGTISPGDHRLTVNSSGSGVGGATAWIENDDPSGVALGLDNSSSDLTLLLRQHGDGPLLRCDTWPGGIWTPVFEVWNDGRVVCSELQLTGGSDLSEQFDVEPADEEIKPGMLVCIDPKHPGELSVSTKPYDRRVAGVISGAGGIETGMLMGQKGSEADGSHPVALTGRVHCWADASNGGIQPGDLLTTSGTRGHAMKVTDYAKAQGAVIGKAMSSLETGQGLVFVLVALQ